MSLFLRISGGRSKKPMMVQGKCVNKEGGGKPEFKAPGVYIKTETRRGHNVTAQILKSQYKVTLFSGDAIYPGTDIREFGAKVVRGLEILGLDAETFVSDMKVYMYV